MHQVLRLAATNYVRERFTIWTPSNVSGPGERLVHPAAQHRIRIGENKGGQIDKG